MMGGGYEYVNKYGLGGGYEHVGNKGGGYE